ncbi:ComEC/Rec2 family competence protein, partial [Anaerovibrio sp.]|uniref:ComEC/Rec2 family competence protein n=1 Tax=Anaerovibrio sp. TaxID=1872532 RepID=UPI003F149954
AGYRSFFAADRLQVHFIDVGQGDAALVITPHGHAFMIDAGGVREGGYDIGRMVDVPYLLHYGVRQLDYIFLTHAHDDHAAGVRGILGRLPVRAVLIGHEGADEYLKAFGRGESGRTASLLAPLQENTYLELDGVRIEILYSPESREVMQGSVAATGNEYSNLIRVSYGDASFLFTGDLVAAQEAELLRRGTPLQSTVLKVGHHGSRTSSSEKFLQAVKPRWAVISCGYGNSFGHPHREIVQRLSDVTGAEILRTDEKGAIVFRTDGKSMAVECYRD